MEETQAGIKLYDFAKEIVKKQKSIAKEKLERCINKISNAATFCDYLLLMCPDTRQFVFFVVPCNYDVSELAEIIKEDLLDAFS